MKTIPQPREIQLAQLDKKIANAAELLAQSNAMAKECYWQLLCLQGEIEAINASLKEEE